MPDAAIDVHAAALRQYEFAGSVPPILDRQQRRRQKRRLALAAVCVAAENPTGVVAPARLVCTVGIVAQCDRGSREICYRERLANVEPLGPQIVQTDYLQ